MSNFTDEELEGLSEEERQAIMDAEDDATDAGEEDLDPDAENLDAEALERIAAGDDDEDDDGEGDGDGEQAAAGQADEGAEQDEISDEPPSFEKRINPADAEKAQTRIGEIAAEKESLRTLLNDGEIGLDEYIAKAEELAKEERAHEHTIWKAEQDMATDQARWQWEQDQFFERPENTIYKDKYIVGALNQAVIDLAEDPKNAKRSGPWFLAEADRMIRERFNLAKPTSNKPDGDNADAGRGGKKPGEGARRAISRPPNLGDMPAAENNDVGGDDEFAHLDKLEGFALEAALAKMSPEQQSRYLGTPV